MTHPHRLHADAALHSLRAARRHLATAAVAEARAIAAEMLESSDGLRGWSPMVGGPARGGHGDPTAGAMLTLWLVDADQRIRRALGMHTDDRANRARS